MKHYGILRLLMIYRYLRKLKIFKYMDFLVQTLIDSFYHILIILITLSVILVLFATIGLNIWYLKKTIKLKKLKKSKKKIKI